MGVEKIINISQSMISQTMGDFKVINNNNIYGLKSPPVGGE